MTDELKTVQEKADKLGKFIAETDIYKKYKKVHEQMVSDEDAKNLLKEYQEVFVRIRMLEMETKPIEVSDKRELEETQKKLHENELLQEYAKVQADFQDLINWVTRGIHSHIELEPLFTEDEEEKG